jgi:hypothetical protein
MVCFFISTSTTAHSLFSIIVAIITATMVLVVSITITILFQNTIKTLHTLAVFGIALVFSCFCIALAMSYSYGTYIGTLFFVIL